MFPVNWRQMKVKKKIIVWQWLQPEMLPVHTDMPVCAGSMAMCILHS